MRRILLWTPLALFVTFVIVFASGLIKPTNSNVPSKMIGQPLPAFALSSGVPGKPALTSKDFQNGRPHLLNIFASWCVPCAAETPQLMKLKQAGVAIDAIAIRDRPQDIASFLARWGDPYARIGSDPESSVQIAIGSSGVPETFVVDSKGIIRHQHIGVIQPDDVPTLLAALAAAR